MKFDFLDLTQALECSFSRRVALRPVALSDAWPLFAATRNPAFNRHLGWARPDSEEQVLKRVRSIMDASRKGRMAALSAVQPSTGEFIGLFRFMPHATLEETVEMGVWVHDKYWHGRYALELTRLCISAAFSRTKAHQLLGATFPENRGSCHLMESVGMTTLRMTERDVEIGHRAVREYTITRADWAARHATAFSVFDDNRVVDHLPPSRPTQPIEVPAEVPAHAAQLFGQSSIAVTGQLQHA
jgi:[ribosomal protein S5]-alanine N-acetyltransferase